MQQIQTPPQATRQSGSVGFAQRHRSLRARFEPRWSRTTAPSGARVLQERLCQAASESRGMSTGPGSSASPSHGAESTASAKPSSRCPSGGASGAAPREGSSWARVSREQGSHSPLPLEITRGTIPVSSEHSEMYLERITSFEKKIMFWIQPDVLTLLFQARFGKTYFC